MRRRRRNWIVWWRNIRPRNTLAVWWRLYKKLELVQIFLQLSLKAGITDNPFEDIVLMEENTVHRIPFTPDELKEILEAANGDDFCHPLIVTGICTAMRRGDVCMLRWKDVDMEKGFITVDTSKTGVRVSIPPLRAAASGTTESSSHK